MARVEALIEVEIEVPDALSLFGAASASLEEGAQQVASILPDVSGIVYRPTAKPVPMFTPPDGGLGPASALSDFASAETNDDLPSATQVIPVQIEESAVAELEARPGVRVWPSSPIAFGQVDCAPYQPAVDIDEIQDQLGVGDVWKQGHDGTGVVVGLLDQGIDGSEYPVAGGFVRAGAQQPGAGSITSHGSMCAADVLVAAPKASLFDYSFLVARSGGAVTLLNAVLEQRRLDGRPHLISNSWAFYAIPPQEEMPGHEVWDLDHPVNRKIREVVASGAPVLFAAGNCGGPCPTGRCHESSIGAGRSIHGPGSLAEVITVAAVNSSGTRIGYSSQGPGMFEPEKPDVASYSHFCGNFGPGRPGGSSEKAYDDGTSAACPVAAGVVALLLSAQPALTPGKVRSALVDSAQGAGGWNPDVGHGIVNAAAALAAVD